MALIFHRLVQKDLRAVLGYYEEEGGAPWPVASSLSWIR